MATNLAFNEQFYLSQNPDVVVAIARGQFANAQAHYNTFGAAEGRDPNQFFDSSFYLSQYPDVLNARANPLEHFLNFGAAEGRFANAAADAAIDTDGSNFANEFDAEAYLDENPDLENAVGPGRAFENAYEHYVLFGQFEARPGTPAGGPFTNTGNIPGTTATFTLTTGADFADSVGSTRLGGALESDFRFTSGNERVVAGRDTLSGDALLDDSTNDNDVLDARGIENFDGTATVQNIENVNINVAEETGDIDLDGFTGVKNLVLTGATSAAVGSLLTVEGIADTGVSVIDASALTNSEDDGVVGVVVNDATADQNITFTGSALNDRIVLGDGDNTINTGNGDDAVVVGDGDNTINTGAGADEVVVGNGNNTINLGDGVNTLIVNGDADDTTEDGNNTITSGSGVDTITINGDGNNTINSGAGADVITIAGAGDNTINSGAGNDTVTLNGAGTNVVVTGEGNDTINVSAGENTITAGVGLDTINITGGESEIIIGAGDSGITATTSDLITGFTSGDDSLNFGVAGSATNYGESLVADAAANFAAAATAAAAQFDGTIRYFLQDVTGGDSVLFVDSDLNGEADIAVRLTGVTSAEFAFTDLVA